MQVTTTLDPHQKQGARFLVDRKRALLDFYTGSGKTLIIALTSFFLLGKKQLDNVLIVGTKSSMLSFESDFLEHTDYKPIFLDTRADLINFLTNQKGQIGVLKYGLVTDYCIDYSADKETQTVIGKIDPQLLQLLKTSNTGVFFDEFHTLKNPDADVTKWYKQLMPLFKRVYGLTATPYTKDLYDIFYLINLLIPKFFPTKKSFTEQFVNVDYKEIFVNNFPKIIPVIVSYKNVELLDDLLKDIRMFYEPNLDLTYTTHFENLADSAAYTEIARSAYTLATKKTPDKKKGSTFMSKLVDLQTQVDTDIAKHALLKTSILPYVEEYGVIIYCDYELAVEQVKLVVSTLPSNPDIYVIDGSSSLKKRKTIKNTFTDNPKNKIVIITRAGGQSLNLQATNRIFFYNTPFDPGSFIQASGRIVRQYSKHTEFYVHFLLMQDTIDDYKYQRLMSQMSIVKKSRGLTVLDITMPSFNQEMLQRLRNKFLWNPTIGKKVYKKTPLS